MLDSLPYNLTNTGPASLGRLRQPLESPLLQPAFQPGGQEWGSGDGKGGPGWGWRPFEMDPLRSSLLEVSCLTETLRPLEVRGLSVPAPYAQALTGNGTTAGLNHQPRSWIHSLGPQAPVGSPCPSFWAP